MGVHQAAQRHYKLTLPAPTGPTTANNSPGLTVKERPCRVGVSNAYKLKFKKKIVHLKNITQITVKGGENKTTVISS